MDITTLYYILLTILAGVIAFIAVAISLVTYRRATKVINEGKKHSEMGQTMLKVHLDVAKLDAATNLLAEKINFQTSQDYVGLAKTATAIRKSLEIAFENAGALNSEEWKVLAQEFIDLEQDILSQSKHISLRLDTLIMTLERA